MEPYLSLFFKSSKRHFVWGNKQYFSSQTDENTKSGMDWGPEIDQKKDVVVTFLW